MMHKNSYDDGITRADIFHYVYALLHHPAYRTRYAENLKRELPRIPFVGVGDEVTSLKSKGKKSETPHVVSYGKLYPLSAVEKMQGDDKPDHRQKPAPKCSTPSPPSAKSSPTCM